MKPQWVIFDVGGVLFDYQLAFSKIAEYLQVTNQNLLDEFYAALIPGELGELTFEDLFSNTLKKIDKHHEHAAVLDIWWNVEHWVEDTKKLMYELDDYDYSLALFTNNWVGMGEKTLGEFQQKQIVKKIFESSVEKLRKPDSRFYELIENEIGMKGSQIFFIDDTSVNIQTAHNRNWQTFLYTLGEDNGVTSNNKLRQKLLEKF